MTGKPSQPLPDDAYVGDWDDDDRLIPCSWCGGEGSTECDDPIQCCDSRCDGEWGPCTACDGLGHSQVVW